MTAAQGFCVCILSALIGTSGAQFQPTWESLDSRKAPNWYTDSKLGVFVHWGVYSVPGFGDQDSLAEWFWWDWKGEKKPAAVQFMQKNYPPDFQYPGFANEFHAEFFDPSKWAKLVQDSGAKYFILTSKHHDGFTNWRSNVSWNWNSVDNGPRRDLVGELADAFRSQTDVHFCLYHSLYEWFNPLYIKDRTQGFKTSQYVDEVVWPQLKDLVLNYKPDYIWSDGDWEAQSSYWKSKEFLAWLYNESPIKDTVLVNDRWGKDALCKHGDVKTCKDRYNPGQLQPFLWENAMTVDKYSWGIRRNAELSEYYTIEGLIQELVVTVSCGGNMVMNVGPAADGTIPSLFMERLTQVGQWMKVNGEGIYGTRPWRVQKDKSDLPVWYTSKAGAVYAIMLEWPTNNTVFLLDPRPFSSTSVTLLGYGQVPWKMFSSSIGITVMLDKVLIRQLPCQWAWVLRIDNVE